MGLKKKLLAKRIWYVVDSREESMDGWGPSSDRIFKVAKKNHIKSSYYTMQGSRIVGVYASAEEIRQLMRTLGSDAFICWKAEKFQADYFK